MFKVRMNRFFALIAVLFCIGANVSAEVKFSGAGSERVVVDSETLNLKLDFSTAKPFYLDKSHWGDKHDEKTMIKLTVGGCQVEMWAEKCMSDVIKAHLCVGKKKGSTSTIYLDDEEKDTMRSFSAVISKDAITVKNPSGDYSLGSFPCNAQFDKSSAPGRYVVDVSLSGPNIAPQLVTTIDADYFPVRTSTTTTTTQVSTTTTSSNVISTTVMTSSCPQCKNRGLEPWLIGLIVAVIVLALLAIALCVVTFCCYRRLQKDKAQVVPKNEHTTIKSTAPGPFIKETNQYGPDMMYFGRDATPVDSTAKSQAVIPAPQAVGPAPATSPMQPTQ